MTIDSFGKAVKNATAKAAAIDRHQTKLALEAGLIRIRELEEENIRLELENQQLKLQLKVRK